MIRLLFPAICLIALWVPSYNHTEPALFGIPFFYWYQVALVIIGAILTWIVYAIEDRKTPDDTQEDSARKGASK